MVELMLRKGAGRPFSPFSDALVLRCSIDKKRESFYALPFLEQTVFAEL